jgi:hypothetical protein
MNPSKNILGEAPEFLADSVTAADSANGSNEDDTKAATRSVC